MSVVTFRFYLASANLELFYYYSCATGFVPECSALQVQCIWLSASVIIIYEKRDKSFCFFSATSVLYSKLYSIHTDIFWSFAKYKPMLVIWTKTYYMKTKKCSSQLQFWLQLDNVAVKLHLK